MALGLRMFRAKDVTGALVQIEAIQPGQLLTCEFCNARVKFTGAHDRSNGARVAPYLSLIGNEVHESHCRNLAFNAILVVRDEGRSLDDAVQPIVELARHQYEFRLTIPVRPATARPAGASASPANPRTRVETIWSGKEIAPYCRAAVGLARIAASVVGNASLEKHVKVSWRGQPIPWRSFYFGDGDAGNLLRLLSSPGYLALRYPIALLVRPKSIKPRARAGGLVMQCYSEIISASGGGNVVVPRIYFDKHLEDSFEIDHDYVVFGEWYQPKGPTTPPFVNLNVDFCQTAQRYLIK